MRFRPRKFLENHFFLQGVHRHLPAEHCLAGRARSKRERKKRDQKKKCLKRGSVGLILAKASAMRISIPLDLSSRSFIPLPRFIRSRHSTPLLAPSLVLFPPRSTQSVHVGCLFNPSLTFSIIIVFTKKTRKWDKRPRKTVG